MMAAPPCAFVLEAKCIFSNFKMYLDDSGAQGGPTWHRPINVGRTFAKQYYCRDLRGKLGMLKNMRMRHFWAEQYIVKLLGCTF